MECPLCKVNLQLTDRQGIEIDYCPKCRGIWLDRGELEKLIGLAATQSSPQIPPVRPRPDGDYRTDRFDDRSFEQRQFERRDYERRDYDRRDDSDYYQHGKPRKKKSWLGEIFDFD